MFRQGDVLLVPTKRSTKGLTKVKRDKNRVILAYGEVTGHAHAILEKDVVLFDNEKGVRILSVKNEAQLVHEEHSTVVLLKGNYEIRIQREYSPEAIRNVQD